MKDGRCLQFMYNWSFSIIRIDEVGQRIFTAVFSVPCNKESYLLLCVSVCMNRRAFERELYNIYLFYIMHSSVPNVDYFLT